MHRPIFVSCFMGLECTGCFKGIVASWISVTRKNNYCMLPVIISARNIRLAATFISPHGVVTQSGETYTPKVELQKLDMKIFSQEHAR